MDLFSILTIATSSLSAFLLGALVRAIYWSAKVNQTIQRHAERFDGTGTRKGIFTRLDDIEKNITKESQSVREAGAKEHKSIRDEMHTGFKDVDTRMRDGFKDTDTLIDGVKAEVSNVREELASLTGELKGRQGSTVDHQRVGGR